MNWDRIGLWCNGSTRHFGRLSSGSKPDSPTQRSMVTKTFRHHVLFLPTWQMCSHYRHSTYFLFSRSAPRIRQNGPMPCWLAFETRRKGQKWGLETYETCFPDVRYEANKRQSHVWYTFTCWFTVIYIAKYSWIPHGCKYLQPRMQTFATSVANVCVRKFIRSSAWGNAFCWPSFQMEMGTWKSSLERDVGYKTAPKRLFRRIWSEIKRLS